MILVDVELRTHTYLERERVRLKGRRVEAKKEKNTTCIQVDYMRVLQGSLDLLTTFYKFQASSNKWGDLSISIRVAQLLALTIVVALSNHMHHEEY